MGTSGNNSKGTFAELIAIKIAWIKMSLFSFIAKSSYEIFHPNSQVLQNHWANESPGWWYLVLTSRLLVKRSSVTESLGTMRVQDGGTLC